MTDSQNKVKLSSGSLRSFIDRNRFTRYSPYEEVRKDYDNLVNRVVHNAVVDMKYTELHAIDRREAFGERFLEEKLLERVEGKLGSAIISFEEKTLEVFDLEEIIANLVSNYDVHGVNVRTRSYVSRKKPIIVPSDRLKSPFIQTSSRYELSAGPQIVLLMPVKRKYAMPVPIKVAAKATKGTRMQIAANAFALSNREQISDRFVDLGHGKKIIPPKYGILALHDGTEEMINLDENWYKLHGYIGEFIEAKEKELRKARK